MSRTLAERAPTGAIRLGPFWLMQRIGQGGAGEVWRAHHGPSRAVVAVKVLTAERARDPRYLQSFAAEVRAVASLRHPGIVEVLDTGRVASGEGPEGGPLAEGSPYLAMELLSGSVRTLPAPEDWATLRVWFRQLLDALGHAHAHGVVHRDLKPGNILGGPDPSGEGFTLKISDFGLAYGPRSGERAVRGTSGTPIYMSPEQFRGEWRDFGPWTDLYALGCCAWWMVTGRPPFQGRESAGLMAAHLRAEVPRLAPRVPVPASLEGWLRTLLEKDPRRRFRKAADAREALLGLGGPLMRSPPVVVGPPASAHALTLEGPSLAPEDSIELLLSPPSPRGRRATPSVPADWRSEGQVHADRVELTGAGLALYGLRAVPLVGREAERDVLWSSLREVAATGQARLVVIQGPSGVGKSRLAEWLATTAEEQAGAFALRANHTAQGSPADGLPALLSSFYSLKDLDREQVRARLQKLCRLEGVEDPYEWSALLALVWPLAEEEQAFFGSPLERFATVHRWMRRLSQRDADDHLLRPIVFWVDDAQWAPDALGLVAFLLGRSGLEALPVLVVATVQEEALAERPSAEQRLEALRALPSSLRLRLAPLDRSARAELVRRLLLLEGELAARVEERCGGNPLFTVQLVGDWVQRGLLRPGEGGFELAGPAPTLPDDLFALWNSRIAALVAPFGPVERRALGLAAVLGFDIDDEEWSGACRVDGGEPDPALLEQLLARRLAVRRSGSWSFTHGMLREAVLRRAQDAGELASLHRSAATLLRIRFEASRRPDLAGRLGRHLLWAGEGEAAVEPLRIGAGAARATSDYAGMLELVEMGLAALRSGEASERAGQVAAWEIERSEALIALGRWEEAGLAAAEAAEGAVRAQRAALLAEARRCGATVAAKRGRLREARDLLESAIVAARQSGDERVLMRALLFQSDVLRLLGSLKEAAQAARGALARAGVLGDTRGQADALASLSACLLAQGEHQRAETHLGRAIRLFRALPTRFGVASALNSLGDALRLGGRLAEATDNYLASEALLRQLGSPERFVPQLNLGLVLVAQGRLAEARAPLEQVAVAMAQAGRPSLEAAARVAQLSTDAAQADRLGWKRHEERARKLLEATGMVDPDVAEAAEVAAAAADRVGMFPEARRAWRLAADQWQRLGRPDRSARAEAMERSPRTPSQEVDPWVG